MKRGKEQEGNPILFPLETTQTPQPSPSKPQHSKEKKEIPWKRKKEKR